MQAPQMPRPTPPREIRMLPAPHPQPVMMRPVHPEPRLMRVAPPPPPPGYRLAGPPPMRQQVCQSQLPLPPRPLVRRIVRVPIPNDEILRREHARHEYERVVALEADRREHARREEFYREQDRRDFLARQEHERRQIEMLRYEEASKDRLAYAQAQAYQSPECYSRPDGHFYAEEPYNGPMPRKYTGPLEYPPNNHAMFAPETQPGAEFENREFDHVYNAAYYN